MLLVERLSVKMRGKGKRCKVLKTNKPTEKIGHKKQAKTIHST